MIYIDYNNCRILRCFTKDFSKQVDVPIATGTDSAIRTAVLKYADAVVYGHLEPYAGYLTKYDYYYLLSRKDGDVVFENGEQVEGCGEEFDGQDIYGEPLRYRFMGGDRNPKHVCYFDKQGKLVRTVGILK